MTQSALGRTLSVYQYATTEVRLFPENKAGLPSVYNQAIREAANDPAILVFAHDDIYIGDFNWPVTIREGLSRFDIVGVAGNRRRVPKQPTWYFIDDQFTPDQPENLSGVVGTGDGFPPARVDVYGPTSVEVKLMDGLFLAARAETLLSKQLFFDERFNFHFYDLDFCREAEQRSLRMGTIQLSIVHQSPGVFRSQAWNSGHSTYFKKWRS